MGGPVQVLPPFPQFRDAAELETAAGVADRDRDRSVVASPLRGVKVVRPRLRLRARSTATELKVSPGAPRRSGSRSGWCPRLDQWWATHLSLLLASNPAGEPDQLRDDRRPLGEGLFDRSAVERGVPAGGGLKHGGEDYRWLMEGKTPSSMGAE
jgi:hypothetical protein